MREEPLGLRQVRERDGLQPERAVEKSAGPRSIDDEAGAQAHRAAEPLGVELKSGGAPGNPAELSEIKVLGALGCGFGGEEPVEVGAIPVGVGNLVVGARRDEELVAPVCVAAKALSALVRVEREAALQATPDFRVAALPRPPRGQGPDARQVVALRELLEQEVGERRGGLSNREARMRSPFDEDDGPPRAPRQ